MFSPGGSQGVPTAPSSPAPRLPQEIAEVIIAHLIYDKPSLLACSLTCRSWYIASLPHLHHTLATRAHRWAHTPEIEWPKPLQNASELVLLPLVKKFRAHGTAYSYREDRFSLQKFDDRLLCQFSELTNVRELELGNLDIPSFMPEIPQYFKHFFPTVRSLTLMEPIGSRREIIYFIGQFQHLEDLGFTDPSCDNTKPCLEREPAGNLALVPPFVPPLRGRLVWSRLRKAGLLKDMIHLFGGIRFRYMDLFDVEETRLLLEVCAGTLETLRLYAYDPHCEQPYPEGMRFPTNDFTARTSSVDFDLSRNKLLRTFEVTALSIADRRSWTPAWIPIHLGFLRTTFSTITSPAFSEVVVLYRDRDFAGVKDYLSFPRRGGVYAEVTPREKASEAKWHHELFEVFREVYAARAFRLVLCADVWDHVGEYAVGVLKGIVAAEKAAKGLDYLPSEPEVVYSPRGSMER
jgi:hypothetical protein